MGSVRSLYALSGSKAHHRDGKSVRYMQFTPVGGPHCPIPHTVRLMLGSPHSGLCASGKAVHRPWPRSPRHTRWRQLLYARNRFPMKRLAPAVWAHHCACLRLVNRTRYRSLRMAVGTGVVGAMAIRIARWPVAAGGRRARPNVCTGCLFLSHRHSTLRLVPRCQLMVVSTYWYSRRSSSVACSASRNARPLCIRAFVMR